MFQAVSSKKLRKLLLVLAAVVFVAGCADRRGSASERIAPEGGAKYVFLFIGDGMGNVHVNATEIYRAAVRRQRTGAEGPGVDHLVMSRLPVHGTCTTYSANYQTTGSAASGTALATGRKTDNGMISVTPEGERLPTVAELAKARGMKVGVISNVPANHATPAVFYAHQQSRGQYHEIAMQIADSCADFLAGSGIRDAEGPLGDPVAEAVAAGFRHATTREELAECRPGDRVLFVQSMRTALDRTDDRIASLAELTRRCIDVLDGPGGFFVMVEGGRIDWNAHANDARAVVESVEELDAAVAEAVDFYRDHPAETLIVVTADHETGGMSLGSDGSRSDLGMACLARQRMTYGKFGAEIFEPWKAEHEWTGPADDVPEQLKRHVEEVFGLVWDDLSEAQAELLETAYDRSMGGEEAGPALYGKREAFPVAVSRVLSERAGISWTTFGHSPVSVPVYAAGPAAHRFDGVMDNTDVARRLAEAMRLELSRN